MLNSIFGWAKRKPSAETQALQEEVRQMLDLFDQTGVAYEVSSQNKGAIRLVLTFEVGRRTSSGNGAASGMPIYKRSELQKFLDAVEYLERVVGTEVDIVDQYKYFTAGVTIGV
jgi:hypothetical protein